MQENIGKKIGELRKQAGMTQDELAERLGVTPQAVSKWENGVSLPDISLLPMLADIFGITIDELFARENTPDVRYVSEGKRKSFDEMVLRVIVDDNHDHVKVNLPLPLVKLAAEMGFASSSSLKVGDFDMSKLDFASIISLIERGAVGRLVEITGDNGDIVVVEVS